jgi:DNA-binding FadR family transcriptional regulator
MKQMNFAPIQKTRIAEQVADAIREAILTGGYQPGDALPSERELAARFQVNRSSVREALHRLEAWQLVEVRQGGATLVRDALAAAGLHLLPHLIAPGGAPDDGFIRDVVEIRELMMGWTAGRATAGATPEAIAELEAAVVDLEDPGASAARLRARDLDFFGQLVRMTGNRALLLFANAIRQVYQEHPELFLPIHEPGRFDTRHHRAVIEALSRGDGPAAAESLAAFARLAWALLGVSGRDEKS